MDVVLKRMGNNTVLVMPRSVLNRLRIGVGQQLTLETTADAKIVLTPVPVPTAKRKHVLAHMIAQCNLEAPPPADLALWDVARLTGQEVL